VLLSPVLAEEASGIGALGIDGISLLVYVVNFGILLVLLYLVAYKPILRMLDQRARDEAERLTERAREEIQRERDQAVAEVRRQFADLAIQAAEQVIGRSLDRDAHRELVEKALEESTGLGRN
jgi:F0F1-type ATP synthase membrane subunit b/b'